jgi:hypothetical protein
MLYPPSSILHPPSSISGGRWSVVGGRGSEHDDALLWRGCGAVTLAYLLVGSFWFQHWYLLWVLAPAALLPASRWTQTLLPAYALGALLSDLANSFLLFLPSRPFTATQVSAISVIMQVLPLLGVLALSLLWRRWRPLLVGGWPHGAAGQRQQLTPNGCELVSQPEGPTREVG